MILKSFDKTKRYVPFLLRLGIIFIIMFSAIHSLNQQDPSLQLTFQSEKPSVGVLMDNILPIANFTMNPSMCLSFEVIQFTDTSTDEDGEIEYWYWGFGDGNSSTKQHPKHTYHRPGEYVVTLSVRDNDNAVNTKIKMITIENRAPIARNDTVFTHINIPVSIHHLENDEDSDGWINKSSLTIHTEPIHGMMKFENDNETIKYAPHYMYEGTDIIRYSITDDQGAMSNTARIEIIISNTTPPVADFTFSPTDPYTFETISFHDSSFDDTSIVSWIWEFGDDSGISSLQHPTYSYLDNGNYTVTLSVEDDQGKTDQISKIIQVKNTPPYARNDTVYGSMNSEIIIPVLQNDEDVDGFLLINSLAIIKSSENGTVTVLENGSLRYQPKSGFYGDDLISYSIFDDDGDVSNAATVVIYINRSDAPSANFSYDPSIAYVDHPITFFDTSFDDGDIVSWLWDFGDGNSSTQQNISYIYEINQTYQVSLTVWDNENLSDTITKNITIHPQPSIPHITITSPKNGSVLSGQINISGTTLFSDSNERVEIQIDAGSWLKATGITTWFFLWNTTAYANGFHIITARVINQTTFLNSTQISIYLNNSFDTNLPPEVYIQQPQTNTVLSGEIIIAGTATDDHEDLQQVEIRIDKDEWQATEGKYAWTYHWNTTTYASGNHIIYARCYDGMSHSAVRSIRVFVDNQVQEEIQEPSLDTEEKHQSDVKENQFLFYSILGLLFVFGIAFIVIISRFK